MAGHEERERPFRSRRHELRHFYEHAPVANLAGEPIEASLAGALTRDPERPELALVREIVGDAAEAMNIRSVYARTRIRGDYVPGADVNDNVLGLTGVDLAPDARPKGVADSITDLLDRGLRVIRAGAKSGGFRMAWRDAYSRQPHRVFRSNPDDFR
jgi:hypothetical protein